MFYNNSLKTLSLCSYIAAIALAFAVSSNAEEKQDCSVMPDYLAKCENLVCHTNDPNVKSMAIRQEIQGFDDEGKCIHNQYSEDGTIISCRYYEESRKFIAIKIDVERTKYFGDEKKIDKNLMAEIFKNECKVFPPGTYEEI
jgi:hypothetical protein